MPTPAKKPVAAKPVAAKPTQAIEKPPKAGPLADIPDYIIPSPMGTEHIKPEDTRIPRLSLAQPQSPQVIKGDPAQIEGLAAGESFNDLSQDNYGDGPLKVIFVRADPPRWIEFDEDRRVVDRAVPPGDPRTEFTTDAKGKRIPPVATMFYDYVVLLDQDGQLTPMALSFKGAGLSHAQRLNGLMRLKPVPIFACYYELNPQFFKNDQGTWYGYVVSQKGWVDKDTYLEAEKYFAVFKTKEVNYDAAAPSDEPNTDSM
jgi:hypothetical protein